MKDTFAGLFKIGSHFAKNKLLVKDTGARFASAKELSSIFSPRNKGLLIDGQNSRISQKDSYEHVAVIAKPGSGKTTAFIIPNIFTPNGDGSNEIFKILGGGIKTLSGGVYNRWGQQVYNWNTVSGGWDGHTLSGKEAASGTYYYVITILFNKGKEETYKGSFALVR